MSHKQPSNKKWGRKRPKQIIFQYESAYKTLAVCMHISSIDNNLYYSHMYVLVFEQLPNPHTF
jgi:hypothetical protein